MAAIGQIANEESGLSVRGKLNSVIDAVNIAPRAVTAAFTVAATDDLDLVRVNVASSVNVTLPNNMAAGFSVTLAQVGAGTFVMVAGAGATRDSRGAVYTSAGQWAVVTAMVDSNSNGTSAHWIVTGDLIA
jgi:hypothetical protein